MKMTFLLPVLLYACSRKATPAGFDILNSQLLIYAYYLMNPYKNLSNAVIHTVTLFPVPVGMCPPNAPDAASVGVPSLAKV